MALSLRRRYLPNEFLTLRNGIQPVVSVTIHPKGAHPNIVPEMHAVVATLANGDTTLDGFTHAYINSELRVVVRGISPRDEVRSKWEVVPKEKWN